jgi:hypothetical protein
LFGSVNRRSDDLVVVARGDLLEHCDVEVGLGREPEVFGGVSERSPPGYTDSAASTAFSV